MCSNAPWVRIPPLPPRKTGTAPAVPVFDCLARGEYEAVKVAENFGINKTTFSRFAGTNWLTQSSKSQDYPIPDLWFNTAQTLAGHPVFVRVADDTGILGRVEEVLRSSNARKRNGA